MVPGAHLTVLHRPGGRFHDRAGKRLEVTTENDGTLIRTTVAQMNTPNSITVNTSVHLPRENPDLPHSNVLTVKFAVENADDCEKSAFSMPEKLGRVSRDGGSHIEDLTLSDNFPFDQLPYAHVEDEEALKRKIVKERVRALTVLLFRETST